MLMKACPRCGKLMPYGKEHCTACTEIISQARAERIEKSRKESNRKYNATRRDPKYSQFYNSKAWRMLARGRLQGDGYRCRICGDFASEVDHIIPIQDPAGWDKRFDYDNLQSLCANCHNKKHGRFLPRQKNSMPPEKTTCPPK